MKFDRIYRLTVGVGPYGAAQQSGGVAQGIAYAQNQVVIELPYSMEFEIRREFLASAQTCTLRIKNLKEKTRDIIYKDRFDTARFAGVKLEAGYKNAFMPTIFQGSVWSASSRRLDRDNIVTEIESFDGGFAYGNSYTSVTLPAGYSLRQTLTRLNGDLIGVSGTPIIGSVPNILGPRASTLVGPTFNLISSLLPPGISATIDVNQLKVMSETDVIANGTETFEISTATGLLDPPVREGTFLVCRMLFEPRLTIGQAVKLKSIDNSIFNGSYQIRGVSHSGIVSPSEPGPATTTLQLYLGPGGIKTLSGAISNP